MIHITPMPPLPMDAQALYQEFQSSKWNKDKEAFIAHYDRPGMLLRQRLDAIIEGVHDFHNRRVYNANKKKPPFLQQAGWMIRASHGLTLDQLALRLKFPRVAIQRWIEGRRRLTGADIYVISIIQQYPEPDAALLELFRLENERYAETLVQKKISAGIKRAETNAAKRDLRLEEKRRAAPPIQVARSPFDFLHQAGPIRKVINPEEYI